MSEMNTQKELLTVNTIFGLGEKCELYLWPLEVLLRAVFSPLKASLFLKNLHQIEIWINIEGEPDPTSYGRPGPQSFAWGKKPPRAILSCVFLRHQYENITHEEFRSVFVSYIEECMELFFDKLSNKNYLKNTNEFKKTIQLCMDQLRNDKIPEYYKIGSLASINEIKRVNQLYNLQ